MNLSRRIEVYKDISICRPLGAFTIKEAKGVVKCNVILYHVYFERQVFALYLLKLLFI
jgi:hypothetical protein